MSVMHQQISYMVNFSHVDKWPAARKDEFYIFNREFENVQTDAWQFYKTLVSGFSVAPDCYRKRHSKHFSNGWYIGLDFDSKDANSDIRMLINDPIIKRFAAFLYTTPSHTDDRPRCRAIFILDRPITSADGYKKAVTALQHMFPHCDPSAKDAARLFYGSQNALSIEIWQQLPVAELRRFYEWNQERIEAAESEKKATISGAADKSYTNNPSDILGAFCHTIANAPDGEKHRTLNKYAYTIGGYVGSNQIDKTAAINALDNAIRKMNNVKDIEAAYKTARTALADGQRRAIV